MKIGIAFLRVGVGVFLIAGCATPKYSMYMQVTYDSDPSGAVLYQGQQKFGYTPYTLRYQVSEEEKQQGYKILDGTSVRWASGATAEISSLNADLSRYGASQTFTFQRPDDVPGRQSDVRFSLELDRTRAMQRQATAQEEQAAAQRRQATAQEDRARTARNRTPTNCTSTVMGSIVNTTCN
jgi:hypothetical protein